MNSTKSAGISVGSFTEQRPRKATSSSYLTSLTSRVINNVALNQYTCRLRRLWPSSHACYLHRTSNNVCYNCTQLTGMLGTVALDQRACPFKLHLPVCMSVLLSPDQQPRHHCHRVSRPIYHYACLIVWHLTSTHV